MEKQEIILKSYREGMSQRAISRETGVGRKTIAKYINEYAQQRAELMVAEPDAVPQIIEAIVEEPKYDVSSRTPRKVTEALLERLQYYLDINENNLKMGMRKQLMKKLDIHGHLVKDGFDISYSSVCQTINKMVDKSKEAFIRAEYELGDICEFDWGEVKLLIDGQLKVFQMGVFTSAAGNYRYATLYPKQKSEFFVAIHSEFFAHIQGNYKQVVYDNMRVAISKFAGNEKTPTETLLKLSTYYCFDFRFCNTCKGNEKGHVEKSVEYIRRKAFSLKTEWDSPEQANAHLHKICAQLNDRPQKLLKNKTANEILDAERPFLLTALPPYVMSRIVRLRVNKYSCINFETCFYSVPDRYVDKLVDVRIYPNKIIVSTGDVKLAEHERLLGFCEWSIDICHYLKTLRRKPGALANSVALKQMQEGSKILFEQYFTNNPKEFIELLIYTQDKDIALSKLDEFCRELVRKNLTVTCDRLKLLISNKDSNVDKSGCTAQYALAQLKRLGEVAANA